LILEKIEKLRNQKTKFYSQKMIWKFRKNKLAKIQYYN